MAVTALHHHSAEERTTTVRIRGETRSALRELAKQTRVSMQDVLDRAVDLYRRQLILEQTNAAYAAMRADPEAWHEEQEERAIWDRALMDGLEDD